MLRGVHRIEPGVHRIEPGVHRIESGVHRIEPERFFPFLTFTVDSDVTRLFRNFLRIGAAVNVVLFCLQQLT